jgi:hypothetical protein
MSDRDNPSVEFDVLRKRVARLEVLVKGILDQQEKEAPLWLEIQKGFEELQAALKELMK